MASHPRVLYGWDRVRVAEMPSKLPVNQIIGETFGHVFGNLRPLARAAVVPWIALIAVALRGELAQQEGHMTIYGTVLWTVVQVAAVIPFQTQVYRFAVAATPDNTPRFGWPWGARETRCALNVLALLMLSAGILAAALVVAFAVTGPGPQASSSEAMDRIAAIATLAGLPTAIVVLYGTARLSLVLPAAAVGHPANWRVLWQATSANGWRLVWITVVTAVPGLLAGGIIQGLHRGAPIMIVAVPLDMLAAGASLFTVALPATAVGLAYRHLVVGAARPPSVSVLA